MNTPEKGVVGIPFFDEYVEKASLEYLDKVAKSDKPFFMSINFMKVHQPNMPHPDFNHKSLSKSKYADSIVENDTRIGRVVDKVRSLGLDKNTYIFWTTDNGAWQDVYPDAGYTPFRGTKGTVREGGNRVPAIAWGPKIKAGSRNFPITRRVRFLVSRIAPMPEHAAKCAVMPRLVAPSALLLAIMGFSELRVFTPFFLPDS